MTLSASAQKVDRFLVTVGLGSRVRELPESTRSAQEAAASIGCTVAQIGKSMIFRAETSGRPVLVVTSGRNRVDEVRIAAEIGEKVLRADPDFVRANAGFAIGGVPPVGHHVPPVTYIDDELMQFETIWVAAGTPRAVFPISPRELVDLTAGTVTMVKA